MTAGGTLAVIAVVACCAGKALLVTGVLAASGALTATPWLPIGAAVTVAALGLWQNHGGAAAPWRRS